MERTMEIDGRLVSVETGEAVFLDGPVLRQYQIDAVNAVRNAITENCRRIVMVSPTGSGKSIIIAEIIRLALEKGNTVLWLVHRRNLVTQMKETLESFGIIPGIIMAGEESDTCRKVQIGTYQTYQRRIQLENSNFFIDAKLLLIDEAHRSLSKGYTDIIKLYKDSIVIGCTATPVRSDNRPMGSIYQKIVDVISVQSLTDDGFLAKARYFAAPIDVSDVPIARGDYEVKALDKKTNSAKIVGDIVQNWLRIAENRPTIVFCVTVRHSIHICEEFNRRGVKALHLDARSTDEEREDAFRQMENGDITVLCNVALYQEGMDCPNISCVVIARPTKSLGLYRQCAGRGLRKKTHGGDCYILDHGGVIEEHGLLTDEVEWTLEGKEKAWKEKKKPEKKPSVCRCPGCSAVFEGLKVCPDCGSELKTFGKKIDIIDADLQEIGKKKKMSAADKRRWFGMCRYYQKQKGYSSGWASHKYKSKTGVWPRGMDDVSPIPPDQSFKNHILHEQIAYAKRKQA